VAETVAICQVDYFEIHATRTSNAQRFLETKTVSSLAHHDCSPLLETVDESSTSIILLVERRAQESLEGEVLLTTHTGTRSYYGAFGEGGLMTSCIEGIELDGADICRGKPQTG